MYCFHFYGTVTLHILQDIDQIITHYLETEAWLFSSLLLIDVVDTGC